MSISEKSLASPLRSGQHHIDPPAAALRTYKPLAPVDPGRLGAVHSGHVSGAGLDLVPAFLAAGDLPQFLFPVVGGRIAEERYHHLVRIRGVFDDHLTFL